MGFGGSGTPQQQPSVSTQSPAQQALTQLLTSQYAGLLPGGISNLQSGQPAIPPAYGGRFAAPLTNDQLGLIGDIEQASTTGAAMGPLNTAQNALTQVLSGQPQDFSQYFQQDVAQPLENTFNTQTLPGIKAAFARSAGGTNSVGQNTGYSAAVGQAATQLGQQLAGANTALGTTAITNAMNNQVKGIAEAPALSSGVLQTLGAGLNAATVPQQNAQLQLSGQQNQAMTADQLIASILGGGSGLATAGTQAPGGTVVPTNNNAGMAAIAGGTALAGSALEYLLPLLVAA